ncbi:MAG: zf-HC2 domain-containing protein [Deltaproteobacteria bacterium]|nr:zf-HC2 domain-containing protein [Deltaproteobacteria bacterium]
MKCQEVLEKISAYIDNELSSIQAKKIIDHLGQCAECQKEFEAFQCIDILIKDLPAQEMPPEFVKQMLSKLPSSYVTVEKSFIKARAFIPMFKFFEKFFELLGPVRASESRTLEEFNDFPPSSLGHIYFKLIDITT